MKERKVDLREQIIRTLEGQQKCDKCNFRGEVGKQLFPHFSRFGEGHLFVCSRCHIEEHRKEKHFLKELKGG